MHETSIRMEQISSTIVLTRIKSHSHAYSVLRALGFGCRRLPHVSSLYLNLVQCHFRNTKFTVFPSLVLLPRSRLLYNLVSWTQWRGTYQPLSLIPKRSRRDSQATPCQHHKSESQDMSMGQLSLHRSSAESMVMEV